MATILPTGEEAAAFRLHMVTRYISEFERSLREPADGRLAGALRMVRDNPLDPTMWDALADEVHSRNIIAGRDGYDLWHMPKNWAEQGRYIATQMGKIAEADAPICDTHGPMTSEPDADAPNGTRWFCAGVNRCRAGYRWLDGTYFPAPTR